MKTIFALSSGAPPAAIAVIRISGADAGPALAALAGELPPARRPVLRTLRHGDGTVLDQALVLWFPGPSTATGEDLAELHCHGGRAVVAAVESCLAAMDGLRKAEPGEFTRRAFANGRMDLAQAEGLADLLEAETELQRASALALAGGAFSSRIASWREGVLALAAQVEAALDFSDEEDSSELPAGFSEELAALDRSLVGWLHQPRAERLKEGYRIVIAGPPNAGKSTLFNSLTESEAAITSALAGTTRDVIERSVAIEGIPFSFVDTAGLRDSTVDEIEAIGIGRARDQLGRADCILWLGSEGEGPDYESGRVLEIEAQIDRTGHSRKSSPDFRLSAVSGEGIAELRAALLERARQAMPKAGEVALNRRHHALLEDMAEALADALTVLQGQSDLLVLAECLRRARVALDRLVGRASTEDMLDTLFGRFCIGK